jgi:endonuclease YncB( thermonuclease family)
MRRESALFALLMGLCATPVQATSACELEPGGEGRVVEVRDAETLVLESGTEIRLVNMISPRRPLWLAETALWGQAQAAMGALERLTLGKLARYSFGGEPADRNGRVLAHVHVIEADGGGETWVQGEMVAAGRARAASFRDNRSCSEDLLALEVGARSASRGLWDDDHYRVYEAGETDDIARNLNHFHLVEGRVHTVVERSSQTYLNFAEDWRSDFTIIIARRDRRAFEDAGVVLSALEGARVRVRGFVRNINGPAIDVTHPEQIELLEAPQGGD